MMFDATTGPASCCNDALESQHLGNRLPRIFLALEAAQVNCCDSQTAVV